ncbi:hypothetical protein [Ornatilinea apprima]|nr:hypothetical protein [Ornatilinea apprima]
MPWADILTDIFLTVALLLVVGGCGVLVSVLLRRVLQVKADREHALKLTNQGNCRSHYRLSIVQPHPELAFTFLSNHIPLAPIVEPVALPNAEEVERSSAQIDPTPAPQAAGKPALPQPPAIKPDGALKAGQNVAAKSGVAAGLLGTLGSLLPGKAGAGLKAQAGAARQVQAGASKAVQAPQAMQRKASALGQAGGRLGVQVPAPAGTSAAQASPAYAVKTSAPTAPAAGNKPLVVQTPALEPGESLLLTLRIGKTQKRYPSGSFHYTLESLPVPEDASLVSPDAVSRQGMVYFRPVGAWRYWLPGIASGLMLLGALLGILYGLVFIWG